MVSKRDFHNVTYDMSFNIYALQRIPWNVTYIWSTRIFHSFPVFCRHLRMFTSTSRKNKTLGGEENLLDIEISVCYVLKHLEDKKVWSVHICYTWCGIILNFKLHRRTRLMPRSSIHSLKIRITSHPCNKYEQITLSHLLSVKHTTPS